MFDLEHSPPGLRKSQTIPIDSVRSQGRERERDRDRSPLTRAWPVLLRRWWQVLMLTLIVGVTGCWYGLQHVTQYYKAEASVMVSPIMPRVMYMTEESRATATSSYYEEYLHTLTRLFLERRVLDDAVAKLAENKVQWAVPDLDPIEQLRTRLTIDQVHNTQLISITARDKQPATAAALVNEVVKSFVHQLAAEESLENDAKVQTLTQEQVAKQKELAALYAQLNKLTDKLGSAALDSRQNVYFDRASSLNEPLNKAYLDRLRADADDAAAQQTIALLKRSIPAETIRKALDADPDIRDMRMLLERQNRDIAASTDALGAEHPLKIRSDEQLRSLQRRYERLVAETQDRIVKGLLRERMDDAERVAMEATTRHEAAVKVEESMRRVMDAAMVDLSDFGRAQVEAGKLKAQIERLTESVASVEKRIDQLQIEARAPGRVALRNEAEVSPDSLAKGALLAIGGSFFAGLLGAVTLVLLVERLFPAMSRGRDLSKYGVTALSPARVPQDKPEAWIELASRVALLSGNNMGVQILAPNGLADARAQALMGALSQLGRRIVILDHDPRLGIEILHETTGDLTRLRLNLATSCGFQRNLRELAMQEKNAFFCAVLPLDADPLLVKDLFSEALIPVVLAASNRKSARALCALSSVGRQVRLFGAIAA
jgi:uncharacterized protein involved in exopolysaccharide biosynthesis